MTSNIDADLCKTESSSNGETMDATEWLSWRSPAM
jgi:hypothetical protein